MDLLLLSIVSGLLFSISGETISGSIPDDLNWLAIEKHVGFLTPYNKISTLFLTRKMDHVSRKGNRTAAGIFCTAVTVPPSLLHKCKLAAILICLDISECVLTNRGCF